MDKKDLLLNILEKIWDARPLWKILLVLWKNWELDDDIIDGLVSFLEEELWKTKDEQKKKMIEKWLNALKRLKEQEQQQQSENEKRLQEIEDMFND